MYCWPVIYHWKYSVLHPILWEFKDVNMLFKKLPHCSVYVGISPIWLHKLMVPYLSPPGLLFPRASLHSSKPLQTGVWWGHQDYRTSVCAAAQHHSPRLGAQRDGSPCLASSQLPQAAGISRGPVLCGGVSGRWFHLRARSLPLHQQQGRPARVSQPEVHVRLTYMFFVLKVTYFTLF